MRVAVIGAGPGGLVTLKYLKEAHKFFNIDHIEVRLFEREGAVGGTFTQRTYEDAELVSSKYLTCFSDFRADLDDPDFLSAERFIRYLKEYADYFHLWPEISLNTSVTSVRRGQAGGHVVHYRGANGADMKWECDAVSVCTGLHVTPNIPNVKGIDKVKAVKHSSQFKKRDEFPQGGTVVILGTGETGMDIAHLAVTSPTKRVVLCHRQGFLGAPKRIPTPILLPGLLGRSSKPNGPELPIDVSWQAPLLDSYLPPFLRDKLFTWRFQDINIKLANWLCSGTTKGVDQWVGGLDKDRFHTSQSFFNKAVWRSLHYISEPYRPVNPGIIERIRRSIITIDVPKVHDGRYIDLAPWPTHIDAEGIMHFSENGRPEVDRMKMLPPVKPTMVVYATGYNQEFSIFEEANKNGEGYATCSEADVRCVWRHDDPTVSFIGFVRPGYGAIPPLAELQAQLWLLALVKPEVAESLKPQEEYHFKLHGHKRIDYGVHHESYAYQLALDMNAVPGIWDGVRAGWAAGDKHPGLWWRLPILWLAGAQFNTKFRVVGPYEWDGAVDVLGVELWETITRREGLFGAFIMTVVPAVMLYQSFY
ncbi:FAD NAD(P)-binding domain-containing protein [Fusarium globosum]|uniref:FAD NAD(P)-binding domain-containing protein n=1 Tax=Fusarium globosum TaxID=78864 RepID=A0A8H6D8K0_9HYPO|nr:FAD NAD(P)-binding domain-containing protein [Fusarium globosum]